MDLIIKRCRKADTTISVYAEPAFRDRVARVAEDAGISLSQLMRNLAEYGLPEAERQLAERRHSP